MLLEPTSVLLAYKRIMGLQRLTEARPFSVSTFAYANLDLSHGESSVNCR